MQLLAQLTEDLPPQAADILLRVFGYDERMAVGRRAFHAAIQACALYSLYLETAESVFLLAAQGGMSQVHGALFSHEYLTDDIAARPCA